MSEQKAITNPFPGLRPFETNEYRLFFGREGQSDALIERLQRARFLAVVGTSGSGKSSLVRAGLLPALRGGMMAGAGAGWRVAVMRPGHDPIGNLARVLSEEGVLAELGAGLSRVEAEAVVEATLRRGSLGLVDAVRQARVGEHEKLLVVVDQFEELFRFRTARMATDTDDDASAFVKLLLETRQPDKPPEERMPIYVVLTMRSDFLGDCAQFQGLPEAINDGQYLIPRMTRDERRFAISGPVRVARGKISEPLVNRLLNDVGDNPDQLPILQHALMRTWDHWHRHRRDGEPIGIDHYTAVGTMSAALSLHADEAWDELPDERSRQIAEVLFKALTERGADNREIRRPTRLREICDIAGASETEVVAVIDVFRREGRSFLMPPAGVPVTSETVVDISHESLIRNWVRLKEWVRDEAEAARIYRRLAEAAMAYRTGEGGLLDEVTLQWVQKWRDKYAPTAAWGVRYHPEFDTAIAYLEESRTARDERISSEREREQRELERARAFAEQQARANHKLRAMMVALAALLLLAMATAVYAYAAKKQAETSERNALNLKDEADKQKAQIA
ncbi:MAG TPA: ATP-binding protein, partial [Pyrinomonadaceae bacterium]|nr:ATP-binding protein [Pyrinomonadaceae bacterium]